MTAAPAAALLQPAPEYAIDTEKLNLWYGTFQALYDVDLQIRKGMITSMIGPSGCGKSTYLRSVNRINERLGYVRIEGSIEVMGQNIYDSGVELIQVRKQVGMVFQRPNPLPISIRDNILFSHRLHAKGGGGVHQGTPDEIVEESLRTVLLWELRGQYTILIVTHNMAQARRASEECIFMLMGRVVEHALTEEMFVTPTHKETADYIEGRYG